MPGGRCHPWVGQKMPGVVHRWSGFTPAFPAQWFYGFLRALPGDQAFLTPSLCGSTPRSLTPTMRRQDHTTSPYVSTALVLHAATSIASRPACRDDREPPLNGTRRRE